MVVTLLEESLFLQFRVISVLQGPLCVVSLNNPDSLIGNSEWNCGYLFTDLPLEIF